MRLKKNIHPTRGIFCCSIFIVLFGPVLLLHSKTDRHYFAQFFSINLTEKIDFRHIERSGVSRIIIRGFQDKPENGGLYFKNSQFRTIDPLIEKLSQKQSLSESPGPQLWGWMITRKFNWTSDRHLFDSQYANDRLMRISKYDLFNKEAVKKVLRVYRELAAKKISGILIQDDFFFRYNEGFSEFGTRAFESQTGIPANLQKMIRNRGDYIRHWTAVKKKRLLTVLKRIIREVKSVNPEIKVGMNLYYETPLFVRNGELWYSHNLNEIVKTPLDYVFLMSYHRQIKEEMGLSEPRNQELFKSIVDEAYKKAGSKLVVKFQMYDWTTGKRVPRREIQRYLSLVPDGVSKICFTPVKLKDFKNIKKIIKRDKR